MRAGRATGFVETVWQTIRAGRSGSAANALMLAVLLSAAAPAQAAINSFVLGMRASGTAPFDVAPAAPGKDVSADDAVVRTLDSVTYRVGYSLSPADSDNLITLTMGSATLPGGYSGPANPQVAYFSVADLPTGANGCANIQTTPIAEPRPATATTSGVSADGQRVYCYQPGPASGSNMDFTYRVTGVAPNGTVINPPAVTYRSASNPSTSTPTVLNGTVGSETFYGIPPLTVSAAPRWQVRKVRASNGAVFVPRSGPSAEDGYVAAFNVGVYAQGSRKGLEALQPSYTIGDNYTDTDMPNARLVTWNISVPGYASANMGASPGQQGCGDWKNQLSRLGNYFDNVFYNVNDTGASASNVYTVANGGSCAASATGTTATLTLTGTDFSLSQYPTRRGTDPAGATLVNVNDLDASTNEWWVASKSVLIWVPVSDLTPNVQEWLTNTATLSGTSITGQANPATSSSTDAGLTRTTGGNFSKIYTSPANVHVAPVGTTPLSYAACDPNHTGDCVVNQAAPGQLLDARLIANSTSTDDFGPGYICERIDNARLRFADMRSYTAAPGAISDALTGVVMRHAAGPAFTVTWALGVGGSGVANGTWATYNTVASEYPTPSHPANTGSAQSDSGCADADATWYPSVTALLAAGRSLSDVTRVRGSYTSFPKAGSLQVFVPLTANATYAYSGTDNAPGGAFSVDASTNNAIAPNQGMWYRSDGTGSVSKASDALRIRQTEYVRITKSALAPHATNGGQVSRGAIVTYQLQVNLTSSTDTHTAPSVTVWDVLPKYASYVPGSSTFGGAPLADPVCSAPGVTPVAPAPFAANSVAADFKACRWVLSNQPVVMAAGGAVAGNLPMLAFQAFVDLNAPGGTTLLNSAFADSPDNLTVDAQYTGATNGFQCPSGPCSFGNWRLNISSAAGIVLTKQVNRAIVPTNTGFEYVLNYAAIGSALTDLRILDVLPSTADGRSSAYSGTLNLTGAIAAPAAEVGPPATLADAQMVVLYTANAPGNINRDPFHAGHNLSGAGTNGVAGTNWCTAAQVVSAAANCPASWGAVTAFLARPIAGGVVAAGAAYRLHVPVMANGNQNGNLYLNDFVADSPSLTARRPGSNTVGTRVLLPDLVIAKSASPATINHGQDTVFTLTARNSTGAAPIENVAGTSIAVVDNLPAGLQAQLPVTASNWDCTASTVTQVQCTYTGTLPVPAGQQVGGDILITARGTMPGSLTNSAGVAMTGQAESPTDNNGATASVTVNAVPGQVVSGRVYSEGSSPANAQDDGNATDPGIGGVTMRLLCTSPAYDQTVTTGADGSYSFTGVTSGAQCTLTQTQPAGYHSAYNTLGAGATTSTGATGPGDSTITLVVPPTGSTGNNFAEVRTATGVAAVPVLGWPLMVLLSALLGALGLQRRRLAA